MTGLLAVAVMKAVFCVGFAAIVTLPLCAQTVPVGLPEVMVYSPRVANQSPAGTFAMPVSALRYEPQIDLETRNLAEGQADVTVRGGIFENTGFRLGAVSVLDPQTGHYLAEIPVAPAMLGAPEILTGVDEATGATNSTVGTVAYGWRPVTTAGSLSFAAGQSASTREELYQGYASDQLVAGQRVAADFALAEDRSDGSIPFGDHHFGRIDGRLQLSGKSSQTDLVAGYQAKFFGWPNLYTPFNSDESENLQTALFALNHRADLGGGDFLEVGAYHRRNKDDYAFNRFAPLGPVHPYQHTSWEDGGAVDGRATIGEVTVDYRGEVLADDLRSTSLIYGRFNSRTIAKLALVPEKSWRLADGDPVTVKAGATYDDTNRDGSAISPVFELARERKSGPWNRLYLSYAQTTQVPTYTALDSSATAGLFRGNPNLGRETSHNFELGAAGTMLGWSGQAAAFYRRDDALVDWTYLHGVTARTANPVNVGTTGCELVARRSWSVCELVVGWTALTKNADYRGAPVDASFYALNYARQRLTAAITARLGHGFELRMDNVARAQAANLLRTTGGNNALASSLGLTYRPAAWRGFALTAQADNLWNSAFQEVPAVPAARRQVAMGASYAW